MVSADRFPFLQTNPFKAFERDLVHMVCAAANISCAVMSAPWQSAFPLAYPEFGFDAGKCLSPGCGRGYPGTGFQARWFDCVAGSEFSVLWSQSLTFSRPYMRRSSVASASAAPVDYGFACHKARDDLRYRLDAGLAALRGANLTVALEQLCDRHGLHAACAAAMVAQPTARNSLVRARVAAPRLTLAVEADYPPYSYINASTNVLEGFDTELIPLLCATAGIECTLVTVPWQSVWAASYPQFGADLNQYLGVGLMGRWFDCCAATWNTILRRPAAGFSSSYGQSGKGIFVAKTGATMRDDASDIVVGVVAAYATGKEYLRSSSRFNPKNISVYPTTDALLDALLNDQVGAAFLGRETMDMWRQQKKLSEEQVIDFTNSKIPFDRLCAIFDDSITMRLSPGACHALDESRWIPSIAAFCDLFGLRLCAALVAARVTADAQYNCVSMCRSRLPSVGGVPQGPRSA